MASKTIGQPVLLWVTTAVALAATAVGVVVTSGVAAFTGALSAQIGVQTTLLLLGIFGSGIAATYIAASLVASESLTAEPRAKFVIRPIVIEEDENPPAQEDTALEIALKKLDAMVGLGSVKSEVKTLMARLQLEQRRRDHGLDVSDLSMHMVFTGPPGVGKTEVARLVGQIYKALGVLRKGQVVEVSRDKLVAGYVGQTALKTATACREALDGILFIDEAYTLIDKPDASYQPGLEAINTLLKFMEDHRDRIIVIVAGYPKQMDEFKDANPGLAGRFSKTIDFPAYTPSELVDILSRMAASQNFMLPASTATLVAPWIAANMTAKEWSNARSMRSLLDRTREAQATRLSTDLDGDLKAIEPADIVQAIASGQAPVADEPFEVVLQRLDDMVGLASVKSEVKTIMARLQLEQRRRDQGLAVSSLSMHMVFTGPPGVGKTEVARLVGKIYKALGVLKKGQVVEVDRESLVAGYVGQTALKTGAACREALDGILFIDEAYTLIDKQDANYQPGLEAINTILKFMEDHRDRVIVIVAGYPKQMDEFKKANPGLSGRFSKTIDFPAYSADELVEILSRIAKNQGFSLPSKVGEIVQPWLDAHMPTEEWSNGRSMRSLLERGREAQALRLANDPDGDLQVITREDVVAATRPAAQQAGK